MSDQLELTVGSRKPARRVLDFALGTPWAITPEALETILAIVNRSNESVKAIEARLGENLENTDQVAVRDGVAVLSVAGPLFRYANMFTEVSGATSYQTLAMDFTEAVQNEDVRAILLNIDSPGGEVNGVSELARMIAAQRGLKPIVAYIGGLGGSAAYWLASAADEIVAADTALLGSIGAIMTFVDTRAAEEAEGVRVIEIVSSQTPNKGIDPLTKDGRARIQAIVDQVASVFIAAVAENRGVPEKTVLTKYGRGGVLVGETAVAEGLADRLGSFEDVVERLQGTQGARRRMVMARSTPVPIAAVSPRAIEFLATEHLIGLAGQTITGADALSGLRLRPHQLSASLRTQDTPAPRTADNQEDRTVKEDTVAAPAGAPKTEDVLKAERERVSIITQLGARHTIDQDRITAWIETGARIDQVRADILEGMKPIPITQPAAEGTKDPPPVTGIKDRELDRPFASLTEQLVAVRTAAVSPARTDPRLLDLKAATGTSEGIDSDGGYLVQPTIASGMLERVYESGEVLNRTTRTPIGPHSNSLKKHGINETSRADGSRFGGVRGYWGAEASTITASAPTFAEIHLKLNKVHAAVYATDELLVDTTALASTVDRVVPLELNFKAEDAVVNGTGAGMPLGILNAPALIAVAKETSQTAATIQVENIVNMYARMWARSRSSAVWLINQDIEPQLFTMGLTVGTGGGQAVFMPAGGVSGAPFNTLMGRPLFAVEYCATLGTVGDILFVDLSQYEVIDKGGVNRAVSIHVRFLQEEQIFRFTMRIDGQPAWNSALTPKNGTNTLSPFVALATRA